MSNTPTSIVRTGQGEAAIFHEFVYAKVARAFMAGWNRTALSNERALMVRDGDDEVADILWELDNPHDDYPEEQDDEEDEPW